MLTAEQRTLRARLAAYTKHAHHDPNKAMSVARTAFRESFTRRALEDAASRGEPISDTEAARRGEMLFRAHMARLSLKSAKARKGAVA